MEKLTFNELVNIIKRHNEENHITTQYGDKNALSCVAVIDNSSFGGKEYPLESRSYRFRSDEKFFVPEMLGHSIFADALDGSDDGVRLDWYLFEENPWEIEYCYIEEENEESKEKI